MYRLFEMELAKLSRQHINHNIHADNICKWDTIRRAAFAAFGLSEVFRITLRPIQVLTVLLALESRRSQQGRLMQMQTGEGKTFVVAAIAVAESLKGVKVDIVTSSSELAVNQLNAMRKYYDVRFSLPVVTALVL